MKSDDEFLYNIGTGTNYSIGDLAELFPCEKIYAKTKYTEQSATKAYNRRLLDNGWEIKYNVIDWLKEKINGLEKTNI